VAKHNYVRGISAKTLRQMQKNLELCDQNYYKNRQNNHLKYFVILFQGKSRVIEVEDEHHGFFHEGSVYIVLVRTAPKIRTLLYTPSMVLLYESIMLLYFCFSHRSNGTLFFNKWKAFYDES
jgi:hypothetical protein